MRKRLLVASVLMLICGQASAGNVTGNIVRVAVQNGIAYIKTDPRPASKPACATNGSWDYAFNINDDTGKATLSMALTAYTSKAIVAVKAKDICTVYTNMEDIKYLVLE